MHACYAGWVMSRAGVVDDVGLLMLLQQQGRPFHHTPQLKLWGKFRQQCWCGGPLGAHSVVAADSVASAFKGQQCLWWCVATHM